MKKQNIEPIKNRRFNYLAIFLGIICIILFVIAVRYNLNTKNIIENGKLVQGTVVSVTNSKSGGSCKIIIDGNELSAATNSDVYVGDTISVRYIKGESRVIQESLEVWRVYLWIGLWCGLLVLGIALLAGGFFPQLDNISFFKKKE